MAKSDEELLAEAEQEFHDAVALAKLANSKRNGAAHKISRLRCPYVPGDVVEIDNPFEDLQPGRYRVLEIVTIGSGNLLHDPHRVTWAMRCRRLKVDGTPYKVSSPQANPSFTTSITTVYERDNPIASKGGKLKKAKN